MCQAIDHGPTVTAQKEGLIHGESFTLYRHEMLLSLCRMKFYRTRVF